MGHFYVSADAHGLSFRRSLIENVDVDLPQVELVIGMINCLVISLGILLRWKPQM